MAHYLAPIQASSGESSQIGSSVDPHRAREDYQRYLLLQQKRQLKEFIMQRNVQRTVKVYESQNDFDFSASVHNTPQGKKSRTQIKFDEQM